MSHNTGMSAELPIKNTRQRHAIEAALAGARRPLLPAEILASAQQALPELGLATVYRNLKSLLAAGAIQGVELPGAALRYELAHQPHHHHFQCRRCQQVVDIPGCPPGIATMAPPGFLVDGHALTLYGLCAACSSVA